MSRHEGNVGMPGAQGNEKQPKGVKYMFRETM